MTGQATDSVDAADISSVTGRVSHSACWALMCSERDLLQASLIHPRRSSRRRGVVRRNHGILVVHFVEIAVGLGQRVPLDFFTLPLETAGLAIALE